MSGPSKEKLFVVVGGRKAAGTAMKSLSDRVTEMGMEVSRPYPYSIDRLSLRLEAHTTNTRVNLALDEHKGHICALQKEAAKLDRQYDLERQSLKRRALKALTRALRGP